MEILENASLEDYSTMRLGGRAAYLTKVADRERLKEATTWAKQRQLPVIMIGSGSNIIWKDSGFNGLVICNRILYYQEEPIGGDANKTVLVKVGAGENWDKVVERTVSRGLSGIESLSLIPGTAGATPVQNVGAYGQEIRDTLVSVEAYDNESGEIVIINKEDCGLSYRTSRFKAVDRGRFYITMITLQLRRGDPVQPFYPAVQNYLADHGIVNFTPQTIRDAVIAIRQARLPDPVLVPNYSLTSNTLDLQSTNREVNLRIEGGRRLHGEVTLKASKNAAVALLCASLLNYGVTKFLNFPRIEEAIRMIEVLESIGVKVTWRENNTVELRRPKKLRLENLDEEAARKTRSVLMLIGPLMQDHGEFDIPYAGGCELGERTVKPHQYALEEFGVSITATNNRYIVKVDKKAPGEMTLYESGNTVTNNTILAAACTTEETFIQAASCDYMVQDLCYFLQKIGVEIEGIGTPLLHIRGLPRIKKTVEYTPTEDPIEAMFFISAAVTTNSEITIKRVPFRWIALELMKLKKMGLRYTMSSSYKAANGYVDLADLTIHRHEGKLSALPDKLHPNIWPGLNPDSLPYFVPIAGVATGRTLIHDWIYERRAIYYAELSKLGVRVELLDQHRVHVQGPNELVKANLSCPPALRPASLLLIGMLAARGMSILRNTYVINRGYEDLAARLNMLGASIEVFS
ncbi:hypothetical protein TWF173_003538 [Orbilia oligospora]|nr:hypothetical protein TWF173_003538 [Orbilia oligospora]